MAKKPSEEYTDKEAQERFEAALKSAFKTPHKPHKVDKKAKPEQYSPHTKKDGGEK